MKVDAAGRLFATGPSGILILSPQAELLGIIGAGRAIANCAFGEDGRTLFFTARTTSSRAFARAHVEQLKMALDQPLQGLVRMLKVALTLPT